MNYRELGKLLDAMQKDRADYYKDYERAIEDKEDELTLASKLGVLAGMDRMINLVGEELRKWR